MDRLTAERMLVKVVELGSFSAAARHFGTGSGQASKLVARLEADLGVKLLQRSTRALSVTEAGAAYTRRLAALIEAYDDLSAEVQALGRTASGPVRLSVPRSFGTIRLAPLLAAFAADHPEIRLDVVLEDRFARLIEEGFDAVIRIGPSPDHSLVGRRLCAMRLLTVAAPAYLDRAGAPAVPADLAGHACILDTNMREPGLWHFASGPVAVRGRIAFSDPAACVLAAEAGLGITCTPDFVAAASLAAGRLCQVLADHAPPPRDVQLLVPGARHLPARVRLLIDWLAGAAASLP